MTSNKRSDYSFGGVFHTALRKGADTQWSTLFWNALHLVQKASADRSKEERVWNGFCEFCQKQWESGKTPSEAAKTWAKAQDDFDTSIAPYFSTPEAHTLSSMIQLCDEETWKDVDASIEYWVTGTL